MNQQQLERNMAAQVNGAAFMTKRQFANFLGVSYSTANRKLRGIDPVDGKYFFIKDIAKKLVTS